MGIIDFYKNQKYIRYTRMLEEYVPLVQNSYEGFNLRKTKNNEPVLTCRRRSDYKSTVQYCVMFVASNRIISMKTDLILEDKRIKIADIIPFPSKYRNYYDRGYGSVLINEVKNWAKRQGFKEIFGEMVSHYNNEMRQRQFYRKNGFSIDEEKKILLRL